LQAVNEFQWVIRLKELGGNLAPAANFSLRAIEHKQKYSVPLATLVPLILILMTITGAVYPAIDLTAGERERGTLESLIATPIPRFAVLTAKYLAVLTVAVLTALMNIVAMTITVHSTGLASILFGAGGLSPLAVIQVFGLMVMFAAFFSAVLLALTSFARSFKEAQAYLIPLMLFAMTPGFLSAVPGVNLAGWWAVTPLANMVLLARDVLERGADPWWAIVAIASTIVYGLSALVLAAHIFGNDAILYGSQDSWEEWFQWPKKVMPQPAMGLAMFTLAMIFPLHVWLTGQLSQWTGAAAEPGIPFQITPEIIQRSLLGGCIITWGLYLLLPLGIAGIRRLNLQRTFQLLPFPPLALVGVILLGFSMWPVAHEIVVLSLQCGLATISQEKLEQVGVIANQFRQLPFALVFFCIAVTPAICEELFFRGYFFSALKAEAKGWTVIVLSGVIFGLFHVILGSGAQVERLFSTTLLGCVLAWVAWRTGSVIPCMLLHLIHNGFIVRTVYLPKDAWQDPASGHHLPISWQVMGLLGTATGLLLVWWATQRVKVESREEVTAG
jgi:ABC-2 type transport system permease protein/sodium transport system permease protein